jgi:hypothetical protein
MIVVIFEVTGQPPQIDGYSDNVRIYHKSGFVEVKDPDTNEMLAMYLPTRIVAIRRVAIPQNAETLHPGDGAERREASPDR